MYVYTPLLFPRCGTLFFLSFMPQDPKTERFISLGHIHKNTPVMLLLGHLIVTY